MRTTADERVCGAEVVASSLWRLGARVVFTVSGNHNLGVINALEKWGFRIVHARHETGAVYMAEGWASVHGQPGICLVTAGPGHTSALTGLACAYENESPVILLSAQSPLSLAGQGPFQEVDQVAMAAPVSKYATTLRSVGELQTGIVAAWATAIEPVPGPVHLSLPTDVLAGTAKGLGAVLHCPATVQTGREPASGEAAERLGEMLDTAAAPVLLLRPSLPRQLPASSWDALRACMPVVVADSPRGTNDPALGTEERRRLAESDLLVLLGSADFSANHGRLSPRSHLAMITSRREEFVAAGRAARQGDLIVWDDERTWLDRLIFEFCRPGRSVASGAPRAEDIAEASHNKGGTAALHPLTVCSVVRELATGVAGAFDGGEFGQWARGELWNALDLRIGNGKLGAIGGAIPQAVGMSLAAEGRPVVAFVGDGTFGYYAAELDTAVRAGAQILVVVGNDSRWAAEWHLQLQTYGDGSTDSTELEDRPYELVAEGFGAYGRAIASGAELRNAVLDFLHADGPRVHVLNVTIRTERSGAR